MAYITSIGRGTAALPSRHRRGWIVVGSVIMAWLTSGHHGEASLSGWLGHCERTAAKPLSHCHR